MTIWQVAAGSFGRDYADRFIRHGLAFVGGEAPCAAMAQVKLGDTLILKRGMGQIVAIGEVVERNGICASRGDKAWLTDFDGWNLEAWCHVDWRKFDQPLTTTGLTRRTMEGVNKPHLIKVAETALQDVPKCKSYDPEPDNPTPVSDTDLITELISFGLRPSAAEELNQALRRIRLLAQFYRSRDWSLTKEHEARTFLVVPLLLALGWAEQKMQIEFNVPGVGRADIACFSQPVRKQDQDNNCTLIIETKSFTQGLDYAPDQAHRYAVTFPSCRVVVVTNGFSYKAYTRQIGEKEFPLYPTAYLNVLSPTKRYPLDPTNVNGAVEVLKLLSPT